MLFYETPMCVLCVGCTVAAVHSFLYPLILQVTNEAVRQLLEQGGLYSLHKPVGDMMFVVDTRCGTALSNT